MRRPRPHRLTGSVRRLLAAAALTALAAMLLMTASSKPASAAGVDVNVKLSLGLLSLTLPVNLPPVPPLPSVLPPLPPVPPTSTPRPSSTATPALPGSGGVPPLCAPACVAASSPGASSSTAGSPTTVGPGPQTSAARSGSGGARQIGSVTGAASATRGRVDVPRSVGLSVSPPPAVDRLTPLAGISFGRAPYLWPLLVLLDLLAAGAVVLLVRRTWSTASDTD